MGALRHIPSGRTVILPSHAVAGRSPASAVRLAASEASNDHASISWAGGRWEARDLGSTNGTRVDGRSLQPKENAPLDRGAVLELGCEAESWQLVDERGPVVIARSLTTGDERAAEGGLLALPGPDEVWISVFQDSGGSWLIEEQDGAGRPVRDREQITVAGQTWELAVPPQSPASGTYKAATSRKLAELTLRFHVSPDEQHVHIEAVAGEGAQTLEERACFFLLLHLARRRLEDSKRPRLPEGEHGWVHVVDAATAFRKEEVRVNSDVYRARKTFAEAGIEGGDGIVERRPRQIRIGTGRLELIET